MLLSILATKQPDDVHVNNDSAFCAFHVLEFWTGIDIMHAWISQYTCFVRKADGATPALVEGWASPGPGMMRKP